MAATIIITDNGGSIKFSVGNLERSISKQQIAEVTIVKESLIKFDLGLGALKNIYVQYSDVISPLTASPQALKEVILAMLLAVMSGNTGGDATIANQVTEIGMLTGLGSTVDLVNTKTNSTYDEVEIVKAGLNDISTLTVTTNIGVNLLNTSLDTLSPKVDGLIPMLDNITSELETANIAINSMKTVLSNVNYLVSLIDTRVLFGPLRIDDSDSQYTYKGYAVLGTNENGALWAIERITKAPGGVEIHQWPNFSRSFVNQWSQRTFYNYQG